MLAPEADLKVLDKEIEDLKRIIDSSLRAPSEHRVTDVGQWRTYLELRRERLKQLEGDRRLLAALLDNEQEEESAA